MPQGALIQLSSSDDPLANLEITREHVTAAASAGAEFILTPEVTNCVSTSRSHQNTVLSLEANDPTLASLCDLANDLSIWLLIGSLALKTDDPNGRFANRSFLINPEGNIVSRYDKIHMFDVQINAEEQYRESATFRPGDQAVIAHTAFGLVGLSICYDLRFPLLYRKLAIAGARILVIPAAFSPVTGAAHWEAILRCRAIETGCYVFAPAQTGLHASKTGRRSRTTHGHSMVVSPWGEVVLDAGVEIGSYLFSWDDAEIDDARTRVPSLSHSRPFKDPN
ncbi:MAG: carbon-nitrogen hydrolase family protein [Aestuariivita sp.]|nr:carbon-nitrogen hydrolase family protein [Aestuariivita sp.]MCY4345826.1 carbon-nitrogen hydrolase family protein [Aestuariivita sp.]